MVRTVLFVDDDEMLNLAVEKRLASYSDHFSLVMARDGFEALKMLENISVSLVVIDLLMPRMDGMSLLSHIQDTSPDIPVILISSMPKAEMPHLAEANGIRAYLDKPFHIDELGKHIMSVLQNEAAGGIMLNVSPTMFLQLMEMECKTCTIRILDGATSEGGILYMLNGQLLDARIGMLKGIEAAYRIFSWDEVSVFVRNECEPRENKINSDLQPIIMSALAAKDEADDSPLADSEGVISGLFSMDINEQDFAGLPSDAFDRDDDADGTLFSGNGGLQEEAHSHIDALTSLIRRELGESGGLQDIYYDTELAGVIGMLSRLGELTEFGDMRVGYMNNGEKTGRFLVAGPEQQATVLQVDADCPLNTITDVLRYRD